MLEYAMYIWNMK